MPELTSEAINALARQQAAESWGSPVPVTWRKSKRGTAPCSKYGPRIHLGSTITDRPPTPVRQRLCSGLSLGWVSPNRRPRGRAFLPLLGRVFQVLQV
jgi:hypothetical protein